MTSEKQEKARTINWSKARLLSAKAGIYGIKQILYKYKIPVSKEFKQQLLEATLALRFIHEHWDKEIWNKED